ncbi:MAG: HNH endonuclease, partial [Acetobacteraceae bacterium]|nr:HNH endonuclease [Acetobacteraceae bacterium]
DIDGYLDTEPENFLWLARQRAGEMEVGDRVFVWRAIGGGDRALSGVIAEAEIMERPAVQPDDAAAVPFWKRRGGGEDPAVPQRRVRLRLLRVAEGDGVIRRDAALDDPILSRMPVLTARTGTNFLLGREQAERLGALWAGAPTDDIEADIANVEADTAIDETTRRALVDARRGQGRFRAGLMRRWGGACAVTGLTLARALRASHAKPWRESNTAERLDPKNGLLLAAHLDALFDTGLISFADGGAMMVSPGVSTGDRERLGIPRGIREPLDAQERAFMAHHRRSKFRS